VTLCALVTGASSGLGRAVAVELARPGCRLALVARDEARLRETAREVEAHGGAAVVARADVRDAGEVRAAVEAAVGDAPLHLVVHAAGVLVLRPVHELTDEDFRSCFEVNVLGTSHVVQAVVPRLAAARGRLCLVSSIAGVLALPGGFGAYGASKWAVRGYAEIVRAELAARGVGLTVAYPSIVDSPMVRQLGGSAPGVYRTFPWHAPGRAARALVRDAEAGRRESYVTVTDRLGAWAMGVAPHLVTRVVNGLVAWKGGRA
jgi:3-dehydrosphinganine reductase